MDKMHILQEIRRTTASNDNVPLGTIAFQRETGIKKSDWYGKYWAKWGDALKEAGFEPNKFQSKISEDHLIEEFIRVVRKLNHFPTEGELRLEGRSNPTFPSHSTFAQLGSRLQRAEKITAYCKSHTGFDDVIAFCQPIAGSLEKSTAREENIRDDHESFGFVYLFRAGRHYKIGKSNAAGRRERELAIQLPERLEAVHVIRTDDPTGIEAYWHNRFADKRKNGEWFELDAADIRAFKRRKFM